MIRTIPEGTSRALDAARVEILRELDAFTQISDVFLEDAPQLFEDLRRALAAGDLDAAEKTAHRLKGASANLGATLLSSSFRRIEDLTREGDPEACRSQLEQAEALYRAVEAEIEEIRDRLLAR